MNIFIGPPLQCGDSSLYCHSRNPTDKAEHVILLQKSQCLLLCLQNEDGSSEIRYIPVSFFLMVEIFQTNFSGIENKQN